MGTASFVAATLAACGVDSTEAVRGSEVGEAVGNPPLDGTCGDDGARRPCRVDLGTDESGLHHCAMAEQTCTRGVWSACGGGHHEEVGAIGTRSVRLSASEAELGAAGCVADPCDPFCLGWDETVPVVGDAGLPPIGGYVSPHGNPYAGLSGLLGPLVGCGLATDCSFDTCCKGAILGLLAGKCEPHQGGTCSSCAGANFTLPNACDDPVTGATRIVVCNRGRNDATTGSTRVHIGDPSLIGFLSSLTRGTLCAVTPSILATLLPTASTCTLNLATQPIPANTCVSFDPMAPSAGITCTRPGGGPVRAVDLTGTRALLVNKGAGALAECDACDNAGTYAHQACAVSVGGTETRTVDYRAVCDIGSVPRWRLFAWDAQVPLGASLSLTATPLGADGGAGTPLLLADVPSADPAVCALPAAPVGCARSIAPLLPPGPHPQAIRLGITLRHVGVPPTLRSWRLTYDCVPIE